MIYFGVIYSLVLLSSCSPITSLVVDLNRPNIRFEKFWTHAGFSPPSSSPEAALSLLSKDNHVNLVMMSALPKRGITHVRIHWLLNLVRRTGRGEGYNWSKLDELLDRIVALKLNLIFEVMGLPVDESSQYVDWGSFCQRLADHLLGKYGRKVLNEWIFELWNEPDLVQYNIANFTLKEYLEYGKNCINGIRSRIPDALIGGPAGLFKNLSRHKLCWGFLDECNSLRNRCRIDFISFHKKNVPDELIVDSERLVSTIREKYPRLSDLPFFNSESDIVSGWWKPFNWRGDVGYAAQVTKVVDLFISRRLHNVFLGISNDNGFLNTHPFYFSQRTLLTRFNGSSPNTAQFVRKPVYIATAMLGMLENYLVERTNHNNFSFSGISTLDQPFAATLSTILLLNWEENPVRPCFNSSEVRVILPTEWGSVSYTLHVLSDTLDHPMKVWQNHGSPKHPGERLRSLLRAAEGPHLIRQGVTSRTVEFQWGFPSPSVGLLRICTKKVITPNMVVGLNSLNISYNEVLLFWKDDNARCIKTYEIEICRAQTNSAECFRRVNVNDVILNSFQFVDYSGRLENGRGEESVRGRYRVRGVNFWGVAGPYSAEHVYPSV